MHSSKGVFLTALLLFTNVHDTIGIDCYSCTGDSQCNDPFDKGYNSNRTMTSSDGWCWKDKWELNDTRVVSRGGGPLINGIPPIGCAEKKCEKSMLFNAKRDSCCCNTNLCNSAERMTTTVSILLTILFFIIRYQIELLYYSQ